MIDYEDEKRINSKKGLKFWRNSKNKFAVFQIHYSADPKKDQEWVDKIKPTMPLEGWLREYEINWNTYAGKPVYGDFDSNIHLAYVTAKIGVPIIRSWDFGYRHPACVWWQILDDQRVVIIDELMGEDETITTFADKVLERWQGYEFEDYGDPAGNQTKDTSEYSAIQLLRKKGVRIISKPTGIMNGVNFIRQLFVMRNVDGKPMIRIHPDRCPVLRAGFAGKYSLALTDTPTGLRTEMPVKDGIHDHLQDAFRYGIVNKFDIYTYGNTQIKKDKKLFGFRKVRNTSLGY